MAHWRVVTDGLVRAVAEGGGQLYVWTVDDARMIAKLTDMGVDGIITNDPRLFGSGEVIAADRGGFGG
jgi:glycerophosphoryl diester phosphodiesterase